MILPAAKLFKVIKGVTFSYTFQYSSGKPNTSTPIDLSSYTGAWVITWNGGSTTLTTSATQGNSGVFFGGTTHTPTNGMVTLLLTATDTSGIPWSVATYTFRITDSLNNVYQLLEGGIGVVG